MKKLTKTNFKTFIKKNNGNLFINKRADFDGMTDCVQYDNDSNFRPLTGEPDFDRKNSYGLQGVWLVGGGRDCFEEYPLDSQGFEGVEVSNCCGCFIVAIKKETEKSPQENKLKKQFEELEHKNCHGEAILLVCENLNFGIEAEKMTHINMLHNLYGFLTPELKSMRDEIWSKIKNKYYEAVGAVEVLTDLTQIKTTKAFRSDAGEGFCDTAWCPECNAENSEDIFLGGSGRRSSDFDTDEANTKIFECRCFHCGKMFRVDYFKEV